MKAPEYLSGVPIGSQPGKNSRTTASLDRKDNSIGYVTGNVQWVHKSVNLMRNVSSIEEFVDWCQKGDRMEITYVRGDATRPVGSGRRFIVHVVNSSGGWGAGFVLALSRRWTAPERLYRKWHREGSYPGSGPFELGNVQFVSVQSTDIADWGIWVVNMVAQTGYGDDGSAPHRVAGSSRIPLQYDALETCLSKVAEEALKTGSSVHMPRIGCFLAGGKWSEVEPIIQRTLCDRGVQVTVYDFPGASFNH